MKRVCPYCGSDLPGPADPRERTEVCPTCGQELDTPATAWPPPPPPGEAGPDAHRDRVWVRPAGEGAGPGPEDGRLPWETGTGLLSGLWRTIWLVLLHPVRSFSAPARPGVGWCLGFGLILGTLGETAGILWHRLAGLGWSSGLVENPLAAVLLAPLGVLASLFVGAAVMHFFLFIVRGTRAGFAATFRVLAYSQAAQIFLLVPMVGSAVMAVWSLVVSVAGLAAAHRVGRGRVVLAMLLPLLAVLLILAVLVVVMGVAFIKGMLHSYPGLGV